MENVGIEFQKAFGREVKLSRDRIETNIKLRLSYYRDKELSDFHGRVNECISDITMQIVEQMSSEPTKEALDKIERWVDNPKYMIRCINNAVTSWCRKMNRRWSHNVTFKNDHKDDKPSDYARDFQSKKSSFDTSSRKSEEDWLTESATSVEERWGVEYSDEDKAEIQIQDEKILASMRKEFKKLIKSKSISKRKLEVLNDRLKGLSFPEIEKKYELKSEVKNSELMKKSQKGQKYRKMLDSLLDELGVEKAVFTEILAHEKIVEKFNTQKKVV
jgi:hypothetical protein